MEKIVIRNRIVQGISSRQIQVYNETATMEVLCLKYGKEVLLKEVFNETELTYSELCEIYKSFVAGKTCSEFETMYVLNSGFGVVINEHIYLCHCNENMMKQQYKVFPWLYIESKKYVGDTWWFETKEIIDDMQRLSLIEFMEKYKGY